MLALAFIALFVVLGLAVVAVAMRSGRPAKGKDGRSSRRSGRSVGLAAAAVIAIFGAAIPAAVIAYNGTTQQERGAGGVELSAALQEGRAAFARNCATCHSLDDSNSVGLVGPDLDQLRPQAELTLNAIEEGRARGMGQMPALLVEGEEARRVAEYVEAVAGR